MLYQPILPSRKILFNVQTVQGGINRIYHRSSIQIEKFQPEGKRIMPQTRFTEALSVDPRVGISRSASENDD